VNNIFQIGENDDFMHLRYFGIYYPKHLKVLCIEWLVLKCISYKVSKLELDWLVKIRLISKLKLNILD